MSDLMMGVGTYILILLAIVLTVGFAFALIVGRSIAKKNKVFDKEFEAMKKRINKRRELDGKATKHEVDLAAKEGRGGWTGAIPQTRKAPPKPLHPHK